MFRMCVATPALRQAVVASLPTEAIQVIIARLPLFSLSYHEYFSRRHRTKDSSLILTLILKSLLVRTNIPYQKLQEGGFLHVEDETVASFAPISII